MSFTEDLINGLASHLSVAGSPFTFRPVGAYADGEFGIYALTAPMAKNRPLTLVIRTYNATDDLDLSDSEVSVQLDFYGPAGPVLNGIDYAFNRLQGLWGGTLGTVKVQTVSRTSGTPLGQDEAGNLRQTENYDLAVHRPSTNRT